MIAIEVEFFYCLLLLLCCCFFKFRFYLLVLRMALTSCLLLCPFSVSVQKLLNII